MTKISEVTVADLRGALDQIDRHFHEVVGIDELAEIWHRKSSVSLHLFHGKHDDPGRIWICEQAEYDADWTEFMDKVWKRIGQIPSREAREIRSVMRKLGDAIEGLADSPSEFATELTARLKGLRDEAGARLITYQGAE